MHGLKRDHRSHDKALLQVYKPSREGVFGGLDMVRTLISGMILGFPLVSQEESSHPREELC